MGYRQAAAELYSTTKHTMAQSVGVLEEHVRVRKTNFVSLYAVLS
jgi:hypothetical protein